MANGDEEEVMLELSIGGIFGKHKKLTENGNRIGDLNVKISQSNELKDLKGENVIGRRELRRKREEKMGSCGSVNGPFVENKEWLETQRNANEPVFKKEKIGFGLVDGHVNCGSFKSYFKGGGEDDVDGGGGGRCCCKMNNLNGCGSDGQCSPHQGLVTDDSRSNSSNSQLDQQPASTSTTTVEPLDPSKKTLSTTNLTTPSTIISPNAGSSPHSNPEPSSLQQASLLARMPCVSTTGNGPNGKTVSGFLYRYTKHEVSIVCVCHGRSFSPAGFVEHAGGVDIVHPLKHITIFPAAFAS